jgi:hypothetical protein
MANMDRQEKRFYYTITEEMVQNPEYFGYRGGRIEVWDATSKSKYPSEYRFFIPEELMDGFRKLLEGFESDKSVRIDMNMEGVKNENN